MKNMFITSPIETDDMPTNETKEHISVPIEPFQWNQFKPVVYNKISLPKNANLNYSIQRRNQQIGGRPVYLIYSGTFSCKRKQNFYGGLNSISKEIHRYLSVEVPNIDCHYPKTTAVLEPISDRRVRSGLTKYIQEMLSKTIKISSSISVQAGY